MSERPLVFGAMPFGYGPAAKALAIAEHARRAGARCVFVGRGVARELVERSASVFDEVLAADADDPRASARLAAASAVVSVMDRELAARASAIGAPLHVVDSLLFMRDEIPEAFRAARCYWAQRFPGVSEVARRVRLPVREVGPILGGNAMRTDARDSSLVVHLGGYAAPDGLPDLAYAELALGALVDGPLAAGRERILVLAGAECAAALRRRFGGRGLEIASLSPAEAAEAFARADAVATSPGLTTVLECFRLGVPTYLLPPQNYSQWCILDRLASRGLAPGSLDWRRAAPRLAELEGLPLVERTPRLRAAIRDLAVAPVVAAALGLGQHEWLAADGPALVARRRDFVASMGYNGSRTIADELVQSARRVSEAAGARKGGPSWTA